MSGDSRPVLSARSNSGGRSFYSEPDMQADVHTRSKSGKWRELVEFGHDL